MWFFGPWKMGVLVMIIINFVNCLTPLVVKGWPGKAGQHVLSSFLLILIDKRVFPRILLCISFEVSQSVEYPFGILIIQ